jgi:hypothetical protein
MPDNLDLVRSTNVDREPADFSHRRCGTAAGPATPGQLLYISKISTR